MCARDREIRYFTILMISLSFVIQIMIRGYGWNARKTLHPTVMSVLLDTNFCPIYRSFESTGIRGHNIFFNPPFDEKVLPMLKHLEQTRQENPFSTRAIIIRPRWKDSELAKSWQPYLKKYKRIHTYPEG